MANNVMLHKALTNAAAKSKWVAWLVNNNGPAALSTLDFLHVCVEHIPVEKQTGISNKLAGDASEIEATIHELVAHELLYRLKLSPEYEPLVNGKTPDLCFTAGGTLFLADVYVAHSPDRTLEDYGDKTGAAFDTTKPGESRAFKTEEVLSDKAAKYKDCDMPFVAFVFLGDHRILSVLEVEKAVYSMTVCEAGHEKHFPNNISYETRPIGRLFLPDENGDYRHRNLSAVICCDWFDTMNQDDPGKRLHCEVMHNWAADKCLPVKAFDPFQQIIWRERKTSNWKPEITGKNNIVAKFTTTGEMEYRPYSSDTPW